MNVPDMTKRVMDAVLIMIVLMCAVVVATMARNSWRAIGLDRESVALTVSAGLLFVGALLWAWSKWRHGR